jgi:hypothetical protein
MGAEGVQEVAEEEGEGEVGVVGILTSMIMSSLIMSGAEPHDSGSEQKDLSQSKPLIN